MRKLLILFGLGLLLSSFVNNESNLVKESQVINSTEYVKNSEVSTFISTVEMNLALKKVTCTATVTYNGVVVATFTSTADTASEACASAYIDAVAYVTAMQLQFQQFPDTQGQG